ncbi:amidohydrolase family protein [Desulfitobacterium sp. AusDCA]
MFNFTGKGVQFQTEILFNLSGQTVQFDPAYSLVIPIKCITPD